MSRITPTLGICIAGAAIAVGGFALPGSNADAPATGYGSAPSEAIIANFAFSPVQARAGESITVRNDDAVAHTLTSTDGLFDTGTLDADGTFTLTAPTTSGSFAFYCELHPSILSRYQASIQKR